MKKSSWRIKITVVVVLALIGWAAYASSKQLERNSRIEAEVSLLQTEAEKIRRENESLSDKIKYFSTREFREQEAKRRLGLKKSDEHVAVIRLSSAAEAVHKESIAAAERDTVSVPNYKKWWNLFFSLK